MIVCLNENLLKITRTLILVLRYCSPIKINACHWFLLVFTLVSTHGMAQSKLYWSDFGTGKIQSSNLDGTGVTDLITGLSNPKGDLEIDMQNQKVYWIESGAGNLKRADLDGSNIETIVTGIGSGGRGLDLDIPNGHIYWGITLQMLSKDATSMVPV